MAENIIIHEISLAGYKATSTGGMLDLGTWGSYGIEKLHLTLDAAWQDLTITAFFNVNGKVVAKRVVGKDGYADVPWEATKENTFSGCLAFEGSINGQRRISTNLNYKVTNHSETTDSDPVPTEDRWNQFVTETKEYRDGAFEAAERANARAEDAEAASEDAQAAARAAKASENAAAAAKEEAVKAQGTAQTAAKSAQDAQAAAEKVRDDAKTAQKGAEAARDVAAKSAEAAAKSEANAKQSADTLAESVKNITPDDSSIGDKPWSSKHIIDMLCPPLEESGNPVVCYPVAGYPLGVKASWEPVQEGSGTPSPENIRPIKGRDSVRVERCGENLLDVAQCRPASLASAYGLTVTVDDTGLIRVFGTPNVDKDLPRATFRILFTNQVILTKKYEAKWFVVKGVANSITRIQSDKSIVLQSPLSPNTPVDIQFRFMYYTGTTAPTTYTPYIGQTTTLTLPETVYGGEVDAVSGEGRKTWKMLTLDGTEKWGSEPTKNPGKVGFTFQVPEIATPTSPELKGGIVCNQYPTVSANDTYSCKNGISVEAQALTYFRIYNDTYAGGTTDEWKAYLAAQNAAGTPVQVAYKLATPTPFTATGAQPISALAGVNTVLTDADSATVTGRADPVKRITDLEDAVASQT